MLISKFGIILLKIAKNFKYFSVSRIRHFYNSTIEYIDADFEVEEPTTYGPCTQNCTRAFNDTMVNHCEPITDPKEEAKCFYKAFATWALCIEGCAPNNTIDYELLMEISPTVFEVIETDAVF